MPAPDVNYCVIPNSVFPTSIKHRSRVHYWLADRNVRCTNSQNVAVLMDTEKRLGDSSIANLLFVDGKTELVYARS